MFRFLACEGTVSAATELQQARNLNSHQFYKVGSLSLSLPATTQSGPTLCCDAKLSRGLSHHSFTLSLSISHQILPCYECAVQVHLVTQTSPVSRGKLLHNRELEYSEYFLLLDTVGGVGQYTTHILRLHSKYLNIRGRQS